MRIPRSVPSWSRPWPVQAMGSIPPTGIGVVIAQKFPDPEAIRLTLEQGVERVHPETVWVMRDAPKSNHAATFAWQTFQNHGIEPFLAPLLPTFKSKGVTVLNEQTGEDETAGAHDLRAAWRDSEMRGSLERIIVFHDKSSNITAEWVDYCETRKAFPGDGGHCVAKIYVVERGKVKTKAYRSRKPQGV